LRACPSFTLEPVNVLTAPFRHFDILTAELLLMGQ